MSTVTRRPTRLDTPLPGHRCPACWCSLVLDPRRVGVCPRCFVLVVCLAPERLQRLVPADLTRLSLDDRCRLVAEQAHLITVASNAWRAAPRTPSRPRVQVR
jgi:hypothetical protein